METFLNKLNVPVGRVDVILDTDTYNEIDDQFALAYLLRSKEKLCTKAIYAAPFFNARSAGPEDGMQKSYDEIFRVLTLCGEESYRNVVFKGSTDYLPDEHTPVISDAAQDLCQRAMQYTAEHPLYVIAIGAITNIASALLMKPEIKDRIVVVWLGGHAHHWADTKEFNMRQDYPAARVVMGSGVPFVQLPCRGVVSEFYTTIPELEYHLVGKNPLADYLARNTVSHIQQHNTLCKQIWDVTAIAWLLNEDDRFMWSRIEKIRLPNDQDQYEAPTNIPMQYVFGIKRDALMRDLFQKVLSE